jgi:hypothetical protein
MIQTYGEPACWPEGPDVLKRMFPQVVLAHHFAQHDFLRCIPPVPGAVNALNDLDDEGLDFDLVTARPLNQDAATHKWLEDNDFPAPGFIVFAPPARPHSPAHKAGLMVHYTHVVDDTPSVITEAAKQGRKALLFDRPWNRSCQDGIRVLGWEHLYTILMDDLELED